MLQNVTQARRPLAEIAANPDGGAAGRSDAWTTQDTRGPKAPSIAQPLPSAILVAPKPATGLPPAGCAPPSQALGAADLSEAMRGRVIFLMGYPGCGKGTQGGLLQALGAQPIPHVSTGALFRAEVDAQTPAGRAMQAAMVAGRPVSDEIVFPYLREKLATAPYRNGFILDGFPKNSSSFEFILPLLQELGLTPLCALHIDVDRAEVAARLTQRLHCKSCSVDYQPADFTPIQVPPTCRGCAGPLESREDDNAAAIINRLDTFDALTRPLLTRFEALGLLRVVRPPAGTPAAQKACLHAQIRATLAAEAWATLPQRSCFLRPPKDSREQSSVFHNHVDAANPWVLRQIISSVERAVPDAQNKLTPVAHLHLGTQVSDPAYAGLYARLPNFHAIVPAHGLATEAFSTGKMGVLGFNYPQVRATLEAAHQHPARGVMTELEEEVYEVAWDPQGSRETVFERGLTCHAVDWNALSPWRKHCLPNLPAFEMHHVVDIPKLPGEANPPIGLAQLTEQTAASDFHLGGWFVFAKEDRWALRSNEFSNDAYATCKLRLQDQGEHLRQIVRTLMPAGDARPLTSTASLEKVHAVWRVG